MTDTTFNTTTDSRFDTPVERRGTGCYKWDIDPAGQDVVEMWVADMDFRTAPCIIEALRRRVDHGVFGYTNVEPAYYKALSKWFENRHGFGIAPSSVIYTPGVVPSISAIIKALVPEGEGVIVQTPVYNCFFSSILNNGCLVVENPLRRVELPDGRFTFDIDFDDLEAKASLPSSRLLLLCNPANPAGRIWSGDELRRVADICRRNGVTIVSDEIHCELTEPGRLYTPMATIDSEAILCLSPSKAFNTAGLQIANIVCPDPEKRALIDRAVNINEVCDVNPFGPVALRAAYTPEGAEWLDSLRDYLWGNYRMVADFVASRLPKVKISRLEATYLPLLDMTAYTADTERLEAELVEHAGVRFNSGEHYRGPGYLRVNLAAPRAVVAEGMRRLANYLEQKGC